MNHPKKSVGQLWLSGWWFGTFFPYIGNHHPKWRTHIFQRGRYTPTRSIDYPEIIHIYIYCQYIIHIGTINQTTNQLYMFFHPWHFNHTQTERFDFFEMNNCKNSMFSARLKLLCHTLPYGRFLKTGSLGWLKRENIQETIHFPMKIMGFSCDLSLKPINWMSYQ